MALTVVIGPPAAGKTTYVRQRARPGDVVIDLDAIAQALTAQAGSTHDHDRAVLRVAQRARLAAINEGLKHCRTADVWVIHTRPGVDVMDRYLQHGAHVVTIDPGRDVVMARIAEQRPHTARAVAERWYAGHDHATVTAPQPADGSRRW